MYPAVTNTVTNTACNGQGINGQLEVEKSVQSGKAWAAKKFQDFQARKLRFSACSEASSHIFLLVYGQLRLEKSVKSGKAWAAKKFQDFQTSNWGFQRDQKQVPLFSSFSMGSYGWKNYVQVPI